MPLARLNGNPEMRLPHILSISFEGLEVESIVINLDAAGIYASAGAACTSAAVEPSFVLTAMRMPRHLAIRTVCFSLAWKNTEAEIVRVLEVLERVVKRLRVFMPRHRWT
jgi:cysteine desulfurase